MSGCRSSESSESDIFFQRERGLVKGKQASAHKIAAKKKKGQEIGPDEWFGTSHDLTLGAF